MCDQRARMLQDQFRISVNHVHALAVLVSTFHYYKNPSVIDQEDRENILRARATGKAVLTSPFKLLGSNHLGVVLTFPVYKSKLPPNASVRERIEATTGYLGGAFDVESLEV
ncbi:hypothetical protein L2E82_12813 [Cichorium intybus]|uniref:Uncharacterized protein n=1 Tax=Cichorium intybus TaxID=13427 RepID=A0ACB9GHV8_CICIN|nr:hypothetical protein L2E82_12813 [Cichorium intybus]